MRRRTHLAVHLLLALSLLLQGLGAVAMPCDMASGAFQSDTIMPPGDDPHAAHGAVSDAEPASDPDSGCCEGGYCAIGGCLSIPGVLSLQLSAAMATPSQAVRKEGIHYLSLVPATPYRPPVST